MGERRGCERHGSCRKVWHLPSCVAKPKAREELSMQPPSRPQAAVQAAEQLYPLLSVTEAAKLRRDVRSTQRRALHVP